MGLDREHQNGWPCRDIQLLSTAVLERDASPAIGSQFVSQHARQWRATTLFLVRVGMSSGPQMSSWLHFLTFFDYRTSDYVIFELLIKLLFTCGFCLRNSTAPKCVYDPAKFPD